ncbi:hypothetical protein N0V87_009006 [Didymella glomerata]|uniref:Uncharacterized protein n=1 Tax=Didymella glomerata TaxID=749621 RepID=A0A9W8WSX4_9PLEO|nr:hypothetical protein N0V87_009006 [Didymella glomerata]
MADFNEQKTPLTLANVQAWARFEFPEAFKALPRASRVSYIDIDDTSFNRVIQRSLGRSTHKKLLVIGDYAPGDDVEDSKVVAHVHEHDTEITFYRLSEETVDGKPELHPVRATSNVAFYSPFSKVGDDTGGSKAIHRVSAVILYYFLASELVNELVRHKNDSRWFAKNFREACDWIGNDGDRPSPVSRPSTARRESDRDSTFELPTKIKREREEYTPTGTPKPKRINHSRKPSNLSEGILSPTDEVLADETMLKHAYSGLQQECAQIKTKLAATKERMRLAEALVHSRDIDLHLSKVRVERAERDAAAARKELNDLKTSLLKDIEKVVMNKFAGATTDVINFVTTMSSNVARPAPNVATADDAPYTSSLLRYDTQLKQTLTLLSILCDVIPFITANQRFQLNALIQATESLHATAWKELEDLKRAELLIQYEYDKPGRVFETKSSRDQLEEGLVALGRLLNMIVLKGDELEAMRVRLLQLWGVEGLAAQGKTRL